jgi:hypothetical protein
MCDGRNDPDRRLNAYTALSELLGNCRGGGGGGGGPGAGSGGGPDGGGCGPGGAAG